MNSSKNYVVAGPNLILFSVALLLAIFAAYKVGGLVSEKAAENRENKSSNVVNETSKKKNYIKENVSSKVFKYTKIGENSTDSIKLFFYEDNITIVCSIRFFNHISIIHTHYSNLITNI